MQCDLLVASAAATMLPSHGKASQPPFFARCFLVKPRSPSLACLLAHSPTHCLSTPHGRDLERARLLVRSSAVIDSNQSAHLLTSGFFKSAAAFAQGSDHSMQIFAIPYCLGMRSVGLRAALFLLLLFMITIAGKPLSSKVFFLE